MAKKVMLISASDHLSGPAKGIFQLVESIDPEVLDLHLFSFQYNDYHETRFRQAALERDIPVHLLIQRNRSYISLVRQVLRFIKDEGFDVVQTHGFKPTFLGFSAKLLGSVEWICFMHGTTRENLKVAFYNLVDNILQRGADRTVIVSEAQRARIWGGWDKERVVVLHNAVDMDEPLPKSEGELPLRSRLRLPENSRVVMTMGRFSPEKGMDVLLEAFAKMREELPDLSLVLVGDGQERTTLEARTVSLGIQDFVRFPGFTETPGDFLAEADLFVLPSRSEGIPNAVLEAMALGVPVVATAVGGVPEIIEDGVSGALVPADDPEALARSASAVLSDSNLLQRFTEAGIQRVKSAFSIEARVAGLVQIYEGLS